MVCSGSCNRARCKCLPKPTAKPAVDEQIAALAQRISHLEHELANLKGRGLG